MEEGSLDELFLFDTRQPCLTILQFPGQNFDQNHFQSLQPPCNFDAADSLSVLPPAAHSAASEYIFPGPLSHLAFIMNIQAVPLRTLPRYLRTYNYSLKFNMP